MIKIVGLRVTTSCYKIETALKIYVTSSRGSQIERIILGLLLVYNMHYHLAQLYTVMYVFLSLCFNPS